MKTLYYFIYLFFVSFFSFSQNPAFKWAKGIGGTSFDYGYSVALDNSGNLFITGRFQGTADFDPSAATFSLTSVGNADIYILKLDSLGNFIWAKNIGGSTYDSGNSITTDASGNAFVTGSFQGTVDFDPNITTNTITASGLQDFFILKLDGNGNFVWVKKIGGPSASVYGNSVKLDNLGNILTTGVFGKTVDFDPSVSTYTLAAGTSDNIFVSKLDNNGNFIWAKNMGGINNDASFSLAIDHSNNIYTTGKYIGIADFDPSATTYNLSAIGNADIFISKLDASGNFVWAKSIGGAGIDYGHSVVVDNLNNIYTTGWYQGTVDFDPNPPINSYTSIGDYDIYVSKLDSLGNLIWAKSIGGVNADNSSAIAVDTIGSAYITGFYTGTVDFDPSVASNTLISSAASNDIFISKLDSDGNFVWVKSIGNSDGDYGADILLDAKENIYTTGTFGGMVDFDTDVSSFTLTSVGQNDVYIHKMSQCHSISANITNQNVSCYGLNDGLATISAVGGTPLSYSWSNGNTNPTAMNLIAGTYSCVITNTCGNVITRTITITQPSSVFVTVSSNPLNSTICDGQNVTLNATGALTYTWTNGISNGVAFTPTISNTYTVIGASLNNCLDTSFIHITVLNPSASSQSVNLCSGQILTVGTTTYNTSGIFITNLIASNGCDSIVTSDLTIAPAIDVSTSQNGFILSANATGISYQWINCNDNSPILGENNQSFTPTANGNYAVIISTANCQDTSTCINITTVDITEYFTQKNIVIYPNPTEGSFTIKVDSPSQISVMDALLHIIISDYKNKGSYSVDLTKMDNGIYFIKVICNTKQEVIKLIKY